MTGLDVDMSEVYDLSVNLWVPLLVNCLGSQATRKAVCFVFKRVIRGLG